MTTAVVAVEPVINTMSERAVTAICLARAVPSRAVRVGNPISYRELRVKPYTVTPF